MVSSGMAQLVGKHRFHLLRLERADEMLRKKHASGLPGPGEEEASRWRPLVAATTRHIIRHLAQIPPSVNE